MAALDRSRVARPALVVLALVWAGALLGVALLAAPAPFLAESLDRAAALDVNRHLFGMLSRAETGLLLAALSAGLLARPGPLLLTGLALLTAAVLLESLWLLPALEARADMIIAGREPPPAAYHALYTSLEVAKLVLLAALAWSARRAGGERATPAATKDEASGNRIRDPALRRSSD